MRHIDNINKNNDAPIAASGESDVTLWGWESSISNSTVVSPPPTLTTTQGALSTNSSNITATTTNEPLPPAP
jgi:hypothetical protein